jgi:membrane protein implicated in regulation of membrane protease activity
MYLVWAIIFVICILIEVFTNSLYGIWFATGSMVSLLVNISLKSSNSNYLIIIEVMSFLTVGLFMTLLWTSVFVKKSKKYSTVPENQHLLDSQFKLINPITNGEGGLIEIGDVKYEAICDQKDSIEKDKIVRIIRFKGNKVIVQEVK